MVCVMSMGFQMNTAGNDYNARANDFLIAYGGQDIVTKDGKLHLDEPKVRKAAIEMLTYPTTAYNEKFVPPGAINWNDASNPAYAQVQNEHVWQMAWAEIIQDRATPQAAAEKPFHPTEGRDGYAKHLGSDQ